MLFSKTQAVKAQALVLVVFLALLIIPAVNQAASLGRQEFGFIGKGQNVFWITEDIGGQYELSQLLQVVIDDESAVLGTIEMTEFRQWDWLDENAKNLRTEIAVPLKLNDEGLLEAQDAYISIAPPKENDQLLEKFNEHVRQGGSNAVTWHKKKDLDGVTEPAVSGIDTKLVYHYPAGFYVNYELDRGYWLPRSGYIVVFTEQPIRAVGMDTMHGFMILRKTDK